MTIFRAAIFHTPKNPFYADDALVSFRDGALAVEGGKIVDCGDYGEIARSYPDAVVEDLRGGCILPGLIDTHIHYPQTRIIGGLGFELLDWLEHHTLPEEARLRDPAYARVIASEFVNALALNGTTTALVFGSHFAEATDFLFEAALKRGVRVYSGLVVSDRLLRPDLHQTPEEAYRQSSELAHRYPDNYVVTPRFALSASEPMLEACAAVVREHPGVRFTSHINESAPEIAQVSDLFPWASDYLDVYERYGLVGRRSVLAHNVHVSDDELKRMAGQGSSVSHCPCSNAALGSGIFPMRRHVRLNVRFALGIDVGGGIGFGILKEGLQAYLLQRLASEPMRLSPAQMLFLATRAGAEALAIEDTVGDFAPGKSADFLYIEPEEDSPFESALKIACDASRMVSALFTMADAETIRKVWVAGTEIVERRI